MSIRPTQLVSLAMAIALVILSAFASTTSGTALARPPAAPAVVSAEGTSARIDGHGGIGAGTPSRLAQQSPPAAAKPAMRPRGWFVGTWETRNIEHGRDVTIVFVMRDDGSLAYDFIVDGEPHRGSTGTWEVRDGELIEGWRRPDGSTGAGRGSIEVIDESTFRLTIVDNGHESYRGLVRVYRRKPVPQLSEAGRGRKWRPPY